MKKLVIFLLAFSLLVFVSSGIFALSCSIKPIADCNAANILMKLSDLTNAHGAERSSTSPLYGYTICCDVSGGETCTGTDKVLGLSSSTNAHAEIPSNNIYATDICYAGFKCSSTRYDCPAGKSPILSLSDSINAHIGRGAKYNLIAVLVIPTIIFRIVLILILSFQVKLNH